MSTFYIPTDNHERTAAITMLLEQVKLLDPEAIQVTQCIRVNTDCHELLPLLEWLSGEVGSTPLTPTGLPQPKKRGRSPNAPTSRRPRPNLPDKTCEECGVTFTPKNGKQSLCSRRCAAVKGRARLTEKNQAVKKLDHQLVPRAAAKKCKNCPEPAKTADGYCRDCAVRIADGRAREKSSGVNMGLVGNIRGRRIG